jgi:hypothetical protein
MSATISVYAVAVHRSWDNYYAAFEGFATLVELQASFPGIAELEHGATLTFRRPKADDGRTPDEFVVLRYDVPATANHLYVQFVRWKYGTLTMTASHEGKVAIPSNLDLLSDCVYEAVWTRGD